MSYALKLVALLGLILVPWQMTTARTDAYYQTIVRILNYSDLNRNAQVCVFNSPQITQSFQQYTRNNRVSFSVIGVNRLNFKESRCQAVYFSNLAAVEENKWIQHYARGILSISDNNPACEIGSAFCLSARKDYSIAIDVNLDALARSKVKIDSQALYIWTK